MTGQLQQGIYYLARSAPGNSFAVVFLRANTGCESMKVRQTLSNLWKMYLKLQEGTVVDLESKTTSRYHGNLTVLIGYGAGIFDIKGIQKPRPVYLANNWLFQQPNSNGGGPIIEDVGLTYANDVTSNDILNDHIIIQFIGDSQMVTHRAIVETWKVLRKAERDTLCAPMIMRSFYTGFNRPDNRSWLGFHDGLSNIRSSDRYSTISIDKSELQSEDFWTTGGTYLAFLRITINLSNWESIPVKLQERIVGRDKATGCPLIGIDQNDINILAKGCPVRGTFEVTDDGNEYFRDYQQDFQKKIFSNQDTDLEKSHMGRIRRTYDISNRIHLSGRSRIFRQGYEFLEPLEKYPFFRVGLNFVSFQGGTDRIYKIVKYGLARANFGGGCTNTIWEADNLLSVRGAGLFLVPPVQREEEFPGEVIFTKNPNMSDVGTRSVRYR